MDTDGASDLVQSENQQMEKIKQSKKPHSARFFDLEGLEDPESFESMKPKYIKEREKKKRKLQEREKRIAEAKALDAASNKKKRRTKDQIHFEKNFKKQQQKINAKRKATISASIDETIEEVIEVETKNEVHDVEESQMSTND